VISIASVKVFGNNPSNMEVKKLETVFFVRVVNFLEPKRRLRVKYSVLQGRLSASIMRKVDLDIELSQ
jgi:hypothetical protein